MFSIFSYIMSRVTNSEPGLPMPEHGCLENEDLRPKTQKRRPLENEDLENEDPLEKGEKLSLRWRIEFINRLCFTFITRTRNVENIFQSIL